MEQKKDIKERMFKVHSAPGPKHPVPHRSEGISFVPELRSRSRWGQM